MRSLFEATVSAISYDVARTQSPAAPPYNDVATFVLSQWNRMPRFLALPLMDATLLFSVAAILRGGLYHTLPPERRAAALESWRVSPVGPFRDFVRFYRSLALMAAYSRRPTATSVATFGGGGDLTL